jgi:hypothetical protein
MSPVAKEICPDCAGDCKLNVDVETGVSAKLDDRFLALTPMDAWVTCLDCGLRRAAKISDLDINLESGRLEFGKIEFL